MAPETATTRLAGVWEWTGAGLSSTRETTLERSFHHVRGNPMIMRVRGGPTCGAPTPLA